MKQPDGQPATSHGEPQQQQQQRAMQPQAGSPALDTVTEEALQQMAAIMASALADLDCPQCCGPVHQFIEIGASIHQEELEWAAVVHTVRYCKPRR